MESVASAPAGPKVATTAFRCERCTHRQRAEVTLAWRGPGDPQVEAAEVLKHVRCPHCGHRAYPRVKERAIAAAVSIPLGLGASYLGLLLKGRGLTHDERWLLFGVISVLGMLLFYATWPVPWAGVARRVRFLPGEVAPDAAAAAPAR